MKKNLSVVYTALMILGFIMNVNASEPQEQTTEQNSTEEQEEGQTKDQKENNKGDNIDLSDGIMKKSAVKKAKALKDADDLEISTRAIQRQLEMEVNTFKFLKFKDKIGEIFIPNSTVADVEMLDNKSLYLSGLAPGNTSMIIHDKEKRILADYQITVTHALKDIRNAVEKVFPDSGIEIVSVDGNIFLKGRVSSPEMASDVLDIVGRFVDKGKIINKLVIETATQVLLKVKVAEVSRDVTNNLGINWRTLHMGKGPSSAMFGLTHGKSTLPEFAADTKTFQTAVLGKEGTLAGGGKWFAAAGTNNLAALIDILASESFAYVLAEPSLVALSGQSATFKSGGEQPYTVRQQGSDSNTTEFKEWGTSIEFTPIVLSEDRINIKVKAEVSVLGAPENKGDAPPLTTKNVETVVELGSGQSLALAGLVQTNRSSTSTETPFLADIPLLGALFRNSGVKLTEKELVIIVTPYVVKPSSKKLKLPTDSTPKLNSPLASIASRSFCMSPGFSLK